MKQKKTFLRFHHHQRLKPNKLMKHLPKIKAKLIAAQQGLSLAEQPPQEPSTEGS
jgi:hypothetical protein